MGKIFALKVPEINSLTSSPPLGKLIIWISVFPIIFFFLVGIEEGVGCPIRKPLELAKQYDFSWIKTAHRNRFSHSKSLFWWKVTSFWPSQCRFCIPFYCITPYWAYFNSDLPFSKYHKANPLIPPQIIFGILTPYNI